MESASDRFIDVTCEIRVDLFIAVVRGLGVCPVFKVNDCLTDSIEVAFLRIDSEGVFEDFKGVVRHIGEHIANGHGIANVIGKDGIRGRWDLERVAREDEVEKTTSDGPNVRFGRRVSFTNAFVLLGSHVTITSSADVCGPGIVCRETKVAEFEDGTAGAIVGDTHEDVFRFDVAVIDAGGVTKLYGVDKLQDHILDGLSVTWDTALEDILVQIAEVTVIENEECIC